MCSTDELHHCRVRQRGDVTQLVRLVLGYLAQDPSHDLTRTCLWEPGHHLQGGGGGGGSGGGQSWELRVVKSKRGIVLRVYVCANQKLLWYSNGSNLLPDKLHKVLFHRLA